MKLWKPYLQAISWKGDVCLAYNRSLRANAILNAVKSGLSIIFPLITYPYAFRILHAEGIGKVDFANSIINYFVLFAGLGIKTYAIRGGAKLRDNQIDIEKFASQVFSINVLSTLIAYIVFWGLLTISSSFSEYRDLLILLSLSIGFTTLEIEWINIIFEDYIFTTLRSILIHIVTLAMLFIFVKTEKDVMAYAALTVISNALISMTNWIYCRRYIKVKLTNVLNLKTHIRPILSLFAAAVAINIYVNADTTMLGLYSGDFYVGLYSIGVKVYTVVKRLLAAVYSVTVPRISYYIGINALDEVKKVYTRIISNITILLLPASTGILILAKEIVICLGGGEQYADGIPALQILAISLIGAIYGGTVTYCLNVPFGRENENLFATVLSAILNIGLNFILIPLYKHVGAAITTMISELFVLVFCSIRFKGLMDLIEWKSIKTSFRNAIIGCISFVVISMLIHSIIAQPILVICLVFIIGIIVYGIELYIFKEEIVMSVVNRIGKS